MPGIGRVIVNTGDGKGKTTAAFGTAFRAAGHGHQVAVVQFIKGTWNYGEAKAAAHFPNITLKRVGSGYTWKSEDREEPRRLAREAWELCKEFVSADAFDLIVMDELNYAIGEGYIGVEEVIALLGQRPSRLSVIITGRGADEKLIEVADTVTEMRCIKHAFDAGIKAQRGVEF